MIDHWINCKSVAKSFIKGKLLYLGYGMLKYLLSGMLNLLWRCLLDFYKVICVLLKMSFKA